MRFLINVILSFAVIACSQVSEQPQNPGDYFKRINPKLLAIDDLNTDQWKRLYDLGSVGMWTCQKQDVDRSIVLYCPNVSNVNNFRSISLTYIPGGFIFVREKLDAGDSLSFLKYNDSGNRFENYPLEINEKQFLSEEFIPYQDKSQGWIEVDTADYPTIRLFFRNNKGNTGYRYKYNLVLKTQSDSLFAEREIIYDSSSLPELGENMNQESSPYYLPEELSGMKEFSRNWTGLIRNEEGPNSFFVGCNAKSITILERTVNDTISYELQIPDGRDVHLFRILFFDRIQNPDNDDSFFVMEATEENDPEVQRRTLRITPFSFNPDILFWEASTSDINEVWFEGQYFVSDSQAAWDASNISRQECN